MSLDVSGKMTVPLLPIDTATGGAVDGLMAVRLLQSFSKKGVLFLGYLDY
jgi:hypothetical protein